MTRSLAGTRGTGSVSIDMITTCSCRTWLCSTLARNASGAVCLPRLRNTAVPGTCRSVRLLVAQLVDELLQRALGAGPLRGDDLAAALPGGHDR